MVMNKIQRLSITLMTLLMATATWAYTVTWTNSAGNPTISAKYGSTTIVSGTTEVTAGQTVVLTVGENDDKYLQTLKIETDVPAENATSRRSIGIQGNVETNQTGPFTYEFVMPIGNVTITPTFANRTSISDATVTLTDSADPNKTSTTGSMTWTYDWLPHLPVVSKVNKTTDLEAGTDYTVSNFTSVTNVEASARTITITGIGKYKDSKEVTYSITARSISDASVQFTPTSFVYNHQDQAPLANTVEVYLQGQHLTLNTDYNNVSIPTSQDADTYTISVTGIGNFTGTASNTYTITKMPISQCTFEGSTSFPYNGNIQKPSITVKDGVDDLTEGTHYTISYSDANSTDVGTYTMTFTAKEGTNYSGSKEITYSITSAGFAITAIPNQTYTGAEIKPTVEVKDGTNVLTLDTHYKVVYSNNINVGTARVSVVGIGSYNGKYGEVTFNITPKSVNAQTASVDDITIELSRTSFTYNASTQKPTVTVKDGGTTLVENKDYTLENAGGTNVGTYHATITGVGNYTGTKNSDDYTITTLSLSGAEITLETNTMTYNGSAQTPPIKQVKIGDVVIPASDYDVVWSNNINAAAYNAATAPTVQVKAKTSGTINLSGSATTTFTIEQKSIANVKITLVPASFTYKNGVTQKPTTVTVEDLERNATLGQGTDYTLTNNGGEAAGTYDVTVTGTGNYTGTAKKYYTISEQAGTTAITVADIADLKYTGEAIKPTPTVTYQYDENNTVTLTKDTHYTLSYENNVNVGEATVIVTLKGGYTGSTTKAFNIVARPLGVETGPDVAAATVTSTSTTLVYNGNVQKSTFTVVKAGRTLTEGVDYEVTYNDDATSAGTQNVTINGIGNYSGSVTGTYQIAQLSLSNAVITLPATRFEYSRGPQTPTPQVKVGNLVISSDDYEVSYDNDDNTSTTPDVTNIGTKTVYVTGKENCKDSKSTTYEIAAKQIDASMVTLTHSVMTYTGSALDPGVVVTDKGAILDVTLEYIVELTNNTNVGTATVKVTGQGNYTGVVQKTFTILEKDHGAFTIADIAAVTYNGTAHQPTPLVQYSGTDLTLNTDYTLSYTNNVNAGTATVTVTGKGGYEGSTGTKTFTINPKTLTSAMVTLSNFTVTDVTPKGFTYNGNNQKPSVTIADAAAPIIADDYDITNAGGVDANDTNNPTYSVTITGKRNYTGTVTLTYKIYQRDISPASVTLNQLASYIYDGANKVPGVSQVAFGSEVVATTEYDVSYDNNKNAGTATVTVTGKKNYTGTTTTTFTIQKKAMTDNMITFNQESFDYDGSNHAPTVTMVDLVGSTNIVNTDQTQDFTITIPTVSAVGTYTVNVEATTTGNYSGSGSKQFSIVPKGSVAFDVAWVTEPDFTYDGTAHTPAVKVTKHNTSTELTAADYDIEYNNNINAGTNTASVTVTGKGNYSGSQTKTFTIKQKPMTDAMVTLSGIPVETDGTYFTYDGTLKKPVVTVSDGTPSIITADDYTISNEGNINAGNYTVTVNASATGNYSGSGSQTYTIRPMSITSAEVALSYNSIVFNGSVQKPEVRTVYANGHQLTATTDYTITLPADADAINHGTKNVTVTGTGNYKDSRTVQYTIDKKPLVSDMIKIANQNLTYTGSDQAPEVTIEDKIGTTNIIQAADYTLSNPAHSAVGNYEVTLTATDAGNYSGQVTKQYSIVTAGSTGFTVVDIPAQDYTGLALTPALTVYKAGTTSPALTLGTDYTVEYSNNVNAGTATVTVTGKGNYSGTQTVYFTINPKALAMTMVTLSATSFTFNGNEQKPTVTVKDGGTTLLLDKDYTVTWPADMVSQGTKTITITGIGNYSGTLEPTYTVGLKTVVNAEVALSYESIVFNGSVQQPTVTSVIVDGHLLTAGTDYTVDFTDISDYVNQGNKTFHITGIGNYSGTKPLSYTIQKKAMTDNMITFNQESFDYDGSNHAPTVTMVDLVGSTNIVNTDQTQDFTITIPTVSAVGTYTVNVEATTTGNYSGSGSKQFSIVPKGSVAFDVAWVTEPDFTYDGTAHTPAVKVTKHNTSTELTAADYDIEYNNNINAGTNTASVTVTGKGNYSGSQTKTFTIKQKPMTDAMVTLSGIPVETDGTYFTYDGTLKKPVVTVSDGTPSIITADDYTISNEGNINAGNYTVTVNASATGNYSGSGSQTYTIRPMSITSAEVALSYNSIVFNGSVQKPEVRTVYANGHQLTATTDYTITLPADADAINHGTKNVTVTGTGNYKDSRTVQYTIDKKPLVSDMIKIANQNLTYTGSDQAPEVTIEDKIGTTNIIQAADYTLSNPAHSAVGNYEVTLTATDAGNYSGQVTKQYSIVTAGSTGFTVVDIPAQDYTGLALTPALTVYKAGTTSPALTLGTDYTVEYSNNVNAGTATVTVTGKGNYSGTQTVYFTINPKSLNAAGILVTLSPTSFSYTGTTQKPEVTVKDGASKTLVLNTDYTLVNDGGIANGTYDVIITGQGNYKDVVTPAPSYTIGGQSLTGAAVVLNRLDSYVYDGNPKTPGVSEVKVGSTVIPAANYAVSYADNVNAGTATVTVTGTGNCSGTATATFDITPKTVNSDMITISPTTFNYDGALHKPTTVIVKDGEKTMVEGTTTAPKDYLLSNPGGTEIGAYSVTITGQGNYTGTASKSYAIVANDASGFSINAIAAVTYNGAAQEPAPVVKEGDNTLSSDYYSIVYLNNINAGTAVVTVTGKNGYTFVKSQTFTIQPKSLADDMLTLSATDFTYNGNVQKPTPTMTDKNASDVSIITSNDYVITNEGGADVGTYHVVVNGQNNYTGSIDKTFTISQLSLSTATITLATLSSYVYDGTAKTPAVQLVKVGELVVPATAYSVAYTSNIHVGTATVTVMAKTGTNFKDGNTTTFNIEQKEVSNNMITLGGTGFNTTTNSFIYDGSLHIPTITVMDGMTPMVLDTDYTLTNTGGTDVGDNYTVTIEGKGNYKGYATKQYSIVTAGSTGFTVGAIADQTYTGSALTPKPEVTDGDKVLVENTDYTLSYSNNINAGTNTASVTVTGKGNYSGTQMQTFTILPKPLNADEVTLSFTAATYTGMEIKPAVIVKDGSITLTKDVDFTVAYPADVVSQGEKTVKITGIRNYTTVIGTATTIDKTYTIGKVDISTASVTLESTSYVYDKTEKKPRVLVVSFTNGQIVPSSGYGVAWSQNIDASSLTNVPTVTVTGKDNYTGTTTATFQINPKPVTSNMMTLDPMNFNYNGSTQKPTVTISDKNGGVECITADDYDIVNEGGKEVGNYTVTLKGKRNYTGEAEKQFSILEKDAVLNNFTITLEETSVVYDGAEKKPAVTVKDGDTPLGANDYTVVYTDNVNVGTATVIVTGKGNYAGTKTTTFTITAKQLTEEMVHLSTPTTFTYNGKIQKPTVIVSDGNAMTALDYTIINDDHSDANTYNVEVIGTHNYTGSVVKPYTISPLSIIGASVTLEALTFTFNTTAQKPAVSEVKVGDLIVPSTDYTVSYPADVTNHGQKMITITAKNNFTGEITKDYTISPKPVDEDMIILTSGSYLEYTGEWLKPTVIVKDGGTVMVEGETKDYTLVNDGAVNVGQYTVSIEGHGNYMGGASKVYNIIAAGSAGFTIADIDAVTYDGTAQEPVVAVRDANTGTLLTKDVNYYIIYTNNKNAGTALANVTGIGNYMGTATKTFKINPKTLTEDMVKITGYTLTDGDGFIYNGITQKPTIMVADGSAMTADDYVVVNNGGLNVNEISAPYEVTITGANNYTGSITKTFNILPLDISDAVVTLYQLSNNVYDGTAKTPGVREVVTGANIMVPTVGYDVEYSNNVNAGTATATVTGKNNFTGTTSTTFTIDKKTVTSSMMTLSEENFTFNGSLQKPTVTVTDIVNGQNIIKTSDYTIINNGGTEVGSYTVTLKGVGNYTGEAVRTYSIVEKDAGTSAFTMSLSTTSVEYNGLPHTPAVTVKDGEKILDATGDYTITYSDNTNAGTATVTVTGRGNYAGTRSATFEITKKPLTAAMVTISGYTTSNGFIYNGSNQKPTVVVRDGSALTASDYVITNNGGTNNGTYHVVVTATGNYSGEIDQTYVIEKKSIEGATVTLYELPSYVYDGTAKKPGVKEVAFGEDVIPTVGYAVTYTNNTNAGMATVTVTGQGNYSGVLTSQFTIACKGLTAEMMVLSNDEYVYNGANQKPAVVLMDGGTEMVLDTDYTLTNEGGISVGQYDVIANGQGNYNGMATKTFQIISKEIGAFEVTLSTEQVIYNGSEQRPTVTVKDGDVILTAGSQYTVNYTDNTNAGTATVTITGQGEYSGTATKTFIIKPKPLTEDMVYLSSTTYTYNTLQQKPTVTVSDQSFLTANDYTLTNDGGIDHGDYDVVVIGRNNYTGTVVKQFTIKPLSIENAKVVLYEMASYVYDGTPKNPGVREVIVGNTIVPTSSYTVEISPNVNVGEVIVTVTGMENFTGTATATFDITPKPLSEQMLLLNEELFYYNGEVQKPVVEIKDGEIVLTEEKDYTLVNEGGMEPGTYEVVAMGMNNYMGTVTKMYRIERSDISVDITAKDSEGGEFGVTLIVSQISEDSRDVRVTGITIPDKDKSTVMTLTIPATCMAEGVTYTITEIAANAFADVEHLSDLYLPNTEEPLTVGDNAVPASTTVHTTLALLDDYALMPSMGANFRDNKVMTTVTAKNQYWTFSSGVDVYVPEGVTVYTVQERTSTAVAIVEMTSSALMASGVVMIKSNNGVLLSGHSQTDYDIIACPRRMSSGTVISTSDHKDYGEENCLVPVIEATHFETGYYILKDNKFCSIRQESEDVKVPAGKAVLYLSPAAGRMYGMELDIIDDATGLRLQQSPVDEAAWYDLSGRRLSGRPTKKGVYIHHGKKIVINTTAYE